MARVPKHKRGVRCRECSWKRWYDRKLGKMLENPGCRGVTPDTAEHDCAGFRADEVE